MKIWDVVKCGLQDLKAHKSKNRISFMLIFLAIVVYIGVNSTMDSIEQGKMYGIMGPLGSGKSTLLNIIGTLEKASYGTVEILGNNLEGYGEKELCNIRAKHIGYIFQNFYLNPYLDAIENVMVPMKLMRLSV